VTTDHEIGESGGIPEPLFDPTIDDFLKRLKKSVGEGVPCPVCGNTSWFCLPSPVPIVAAGTGEARTFSTLLMICERCRFIRSHLITPLRLMAEKG
jgi:hypothetical protein